MRPSARATAADPGIRVDVAELAAVAGLAATLVVAMAFGTLVHAHDLERTAVTLTIESDGRFDLVVENDPNWLLLRLERFGATTTVNDGAASGSLSAAERDARLRALAPVFIDRIVLFVDGHEIRPDSATYVPPTTEEAADGRPARAAYLLRGSLPADARSLRWYYGLVIDPYPLTVHHADGGDVSELVLGDAWSGSLDLAGPFAAPSRFQVARASFARGFAALLPRGLIHVLFVLAVVVGGASRRSMVARLVTFAVGMSTGLSVDALGLTRLPLGPVDVLVALSIVYIGFDNLITWRAGVAPFAFAGLVHGARLAHSAIDASSMRHHATTALVSVDLGVTAGVLTVALIGLACLASFRGDAWYRNRVVIPASIALVCAGAYWLVCSVAA